MKDTEVSLASVAINTVQNGIGLDRVTIEENGGKFSLKHGTVLRLEWPSSLNLCVSETDVDGYEVRFEDGMEIPHGVSANLMLTDLDDPDVVIRVALAQVSQLQIYADFPEERVTFELVSPRGATYGAQSISIHDKKLKQYFVID